MATSAKLRTTNKSTIYNQLKADFYKNVNDIMKQSYLETMDIHEKIEEAQQQSWFGKLLKDTIKGTFLVDELTLVGGTLYDLMKGARGAFGNAWTGINQAMSVFVENALSIPYAGDGVDWREDLAFTVSNLTANIVKGLGTATLGFVTFGGQALGVKEIPQLFTGNTIDIKSWGEKKAQELEVFSNKIIGSAIEEARYGQPLRRTIGAMALGESIPELAYQDRETDFDNSEFVDQYIDSRFDRNTPLANWGRNFRDKKTKKNQAFQEQWYLDKWFGLGIQEKMDDFFDKQIAKTKHAEFYEKYVRPTATSIGEILPSMFFSSLGSKSSLKQVNDSLQTIAKLFFVSNVYGRSYQEAVLEGATQNDAHVFGIGNAGLEIMAESIGGFVPGKPLATSTKSILKSITTEAMEEAIAEISQPGLNFWLSKDRNFEDVSTEDLRERVVFAATVGGLSGGIFGTVGSITARTSPEANLQALNREFQKTEDLRNDSIIQENISKLEQNLNDPNIPQWRKQQILANPLYNQLVREVSVDAPISPMSIVGGPTPVQQQNVGRRYELTDVGRRFAEGDFVSQQGDLSITKETYAVGSQEYVTDYLQSNEFGNIEIVKMNDVKNYSEQIQQDINWVRDNDLRVAIVKQTSVDSGLEVPAFTDLNTGMIYINVEAAKNAQGFKNALAHEMHDKMNVLYKNGSLTQKQFNAYQKFADSIQDGQFDNILEQVGWKDVEEFYVRQVLNEQQTQQADQSGYQSVELNTQQQQQIAREKISKVIESVFDNETILRRAYGQNPSILRSIADIFSNTKKFNEQFNVEGGVLQDMLTNMQSNFQKLLKESRDFAFGPQNIAEGILQQRFFSPQQMFTNDAYMVNTHKPTFVVNEQIELALITRTPEAMMNIVGYDPNFDISKQYESVVDIKKKIDHEYFRQNMPNTIEGSPDADYYGSIEGKDYFFKVGRKLYDRNQFQIPEGAENVRISFVDNNYFELAYDFNPEFREASDLELDIQDGLLKKKIYPDVELRDGTILEKPIMLVASMNNARVEFMMKNNGLLPSQSINLQSATAMTLGSQEFEGVFVGENGHEFTMSFIFRNNTVESNGFQVFQGDANTPTVMFPKTETSMFDGPDLYDTYNVDAKKRLILKLDGYTLERSWIYDGQYFESAYKNKADVLNQTLNILVAQSKIDLEMTVDTTSIESINQRLSTIVSVLDRVSKTNQTKNTKASLKERINRQGNTPAEVFAKARQAAKSLYNVFNNVKDGEYNQLNYIGKVIDYAMNNESKLTYQMDQTVSETYDTYRQDFDAIVDYMNLSEYQIDGISEANHSKADISMVGAAYITHMGENKNSLKYQEIVNFLRENGVEVQDLMNPNSIEQMKKVSKFDDSQGNFLATSMYKYNHIDKGNQSVVNNALNNDIENGLNLAFEVEVKKDAESNTPNNKKILREQSVDIEGISASNVLEQQAINQSQTANTIKTMQATSALAKKTNKFQSLNYKSLQNAQANAQSHTKQIYKDLNKDFVRFIDNNIESIRKQNVKEFKNIVGLYDSYQSVLRKDVRANRYVNHLTSSVLQTLIQEMGQAYNKALNDPKRKSLELTSREVGNVLNKVNEAIFGTIDYMSDLTSPRYVSENNPTGMIYAKYSHWYLREFLNADLSNQTTLQQFAETDTRGDFYRRLLNAIYNINQKNGFQELDGAIAEFFQATDIEKVSDLSLRPGDTQRTQTDVLRQWTNDAQNNKTLKTSVKFNTLLPKGYSSLVDPYSYFQIQGLFNDQSWSSVLHKKMVQAQESMITIDRVFDNFMNQDGWLNENYKEIKRMERKSETYKVNELGGAEVNLSQIVFLKDMLAREIMRNRAIDLGIIEGSKSEHFRNGNLINILFLAEDSATKFDKRTDATIRDNMALLQELDGIINQNPVAVEYNNKVLNLFKELFPYINERFVELNGQPLTNEGIEIKNSLENLTAQQVSELFKDIPDSINRETVDSLYVPIYVGQAGYFRDASVNLKNIIDLGVFDGMTQQISEGVDSSVKVDSITNVLYKYKQEVRNYYGMHRVMHDWNNVINQAMPGYAQTTTLKALITEQSVNYVENLMKDMAGYSSVQPTIARKSLNFLRRNFFRASLGANIKVIATQLNTIWNLSNLYGDNPATFFPAMYKNLFMQMSPKNRQLVQELKDNNNIFYNRGFQPTFDVGEATRQGIDSNSGFSQIMNLFMSGIRLTDSSVNRAFYLTLLETTNPQTNALYTKAEANAMVTDGIIRSQSSALDIAKAPILRTDNDLIKLMVKFMGEPLKLQSQIYTAKKKLEYVNKIEKNVSQLKESLNARETQSLAQLGVGLATLQRLEALENSPDFATMETQQQEQIRRDIREQKVKVRDQQIQHSELVENVTTMKDQMDMTIASKGQTRTDMLRRVSALLGTMIYISALGVGWSAIRSDMGRLSDREEDEELANYLARKMGVEIGNSFAGMFPFIRDIYGFVTSGYSFDTIDEVRVLQDTTRVLTGFIEDIVSGNEINPYQFARQIAVFGGRTFGVPVSNLENLAVAAMMTTGQQDDYYRYRALTGQRISTNKELAQAVTDGRDDLVQAIVETRLASREVTISDSVLSEIVGLARLGANVTMTSVNDSYTINGIEYTMTPQEKVQFTSIYNQADFVLQRLITSSSYRRLNDENKASLMRSVYNYYLRLAQQTVFGIDLVPESRNFRTMNQAFSYFRDTVANQLLEQQRRERQR